MNVASIFKTMDYGPAPESKEQAEEWIKSRGPRFKQFINGKWVVPGSGKYIHSNNPCTNKKLASIPLANKADVDIAVKAAEKALPAWQKFLHSFVFA